jgi:hypothetical protein
MMHIFIRIKIIAALIAALFGTAITYLKIARHWLTTWGSTPAEHEMKLAGDDLIPGGVRATVNMTHATTIDALPDKIWPWLVQMGQDRAGFYSFERLERLLGFGIRNTYRIVYDWQDLKAGDFCMFHQYGIGMRIVEVGKNSHIVMLTDSHKRATLKPGQMELLPPESWDWHVAWNWSFNLIDLPGGKTRFLVRGLAVWDPINPVVDSILDFLVVVPSCIMQMQMCRELKQISEGTHPALCIGHPE